MAYIYEQDVTKVGGNLQKTVAYLLSLHKNEYEWNLLGIRVIGVKEALPIPDGTYDYGDAYMIGNKTDGFELWIYTRADEFHTEAYWFDVGQFPKAGPKGDKGDGLEQINSWTNGTVGNVTYDTTNGAKVTQTSTVDYTDSTDGSTKQQQFNTTTTLPIVPGKYISMNATSDNKKMEVKVDDTALKLDYYKIDKSYTYPVIPLWSGSSQIAAVPTDAATPYSLAQRDVYGNSKFQALYNSLLVGLDAPYMQATMNEVYRACRTAGTDQIIDKTSTDTGTMSADLLAVFTGTPNSHIIYDNQAYYRMDPTSAPNGTLNFIHLDSIDDGNGGYKATGKCFSITVNTREWKVFDLDFGGQTTHNLLITDNVSGNGYYFQLATNRSAAYTTADVSTIIAEVKGKIIPCVFRQGTDSSKKFYSGILQANDAGFSCYYGEQNMDFGMTPAQVTVRDNV